MWRLAKTAMVLLVLDRDVVLFPLFVAFAWNILGRESRLLIIGSCICLTI